MNLKSIIHKSYSYFSILQLQILPRYYGFVKGHDYLTTEDVATIEQTFSVNNQNIVKLYEEKFASSIGNGYGISFAAGRMAFYCLMTTLGISKGDEVILLGFTCAVMSNAVLRTGAKPVYSDVDSITFGSESNSIKSLINSRTRMIVAQHSFGIPCKIEEITEIAKKHNIFLLEDCSISFDSSRYDITLGNWGNAAIFSTDHSKPLNTIIGGFLYTTDLNLYQRVKLNVESIPAIPFDHQYRLFKRFMFEKKYFVPDKYQRAKLLDAFSEIWNKFLPNTATFLDGDNINPRYNHKKYPYPAKLPAFLAQIGLKELERWPMEKLRRKNVLTHYVELFCKSYLKKDLSEAYFDKRNSITPLRFVFQTPNAEIFIKKLSKYIDINWFWFTSPIIATHSSLASLGYQSGDCKTSEEISKQIINLPCVLTQDSEEYLLERISTILTSFVK